jgi:hypothetical protein
MTLVEESSPFASTTGDVVMVNALACESRTEQRQNDSEVERDVGGEAQHKQFLVHEAVEFGHLNNVVSHFLR